MDQYQEHYQAWRWQVPESFNMVDAIRTHALTQPQALAVTCVTRDQGRRQMSYAALMARANQLSNALAAQGIQRGDKVAICLGQRVETAIAYVAVLQMGAVAVPLTILFGAEAMAYRLTHAEVKLMLVEAQSYEVVRTLANRPGLIHLDAVDGVCCFDDLLSQQSDSFSPVHTLATDPALIIYTSGTTGPPKAALIPHQALLGNIPGFYYSHNCFPKAAEAAAVFWSPADWAWTGGLMDALLPTLYFGQHIIGCNQRFDAKLAFALMEEFGVTHSFLFPTALKQMMKAYPEPRAHFTLRLNSIMSAGETLNASVFEWVQKALGVTANEMFGQTEVNYIVGNCAALWPAKAGAMGRAYPGHRVTTIDESGRECAVGVAGEVAVRRADVHGQADPVFFLGYWRNDTATAEKYTGEWCRTGDSAVRDADGYFWYEGRSDDVIKSAGYRIGPGEVENCLLKHPAVANAAVVGVPDAERGSLVKAFIVLQQGYSASAELEASLATHVRGQLAPYEYPKLFEFLSELPMTTTGKVQRKVLRERR